jgi:transcriptional regulator with XRE-family HTH domain
MARPTIPLEQKRAEGAALRRKLNAIQAQDKSITQESLASEMGLTQGTLGQWLTGKTAIPDKRLIWLGNRLGFDAREIRPTLNDYLLPENQTPQERRLLEAYRADPDLRRAIEAIVEMSPFYGKNH